MFGKQLTLFHILSFKVRLDVSWIFLALLVTWSLAQGYFPANYLGLSDSTYWSMGVFGAIGLFGSIVFHELAHSLVARRYGIPISSITLFIFGGVAQMDKEPPNPKAEFLMAIAGPLSSFALSGVSYLAFKVGYQVHVPLPALGVLGYLAFANSLLGGFNLVPAFPLDGGRALRAGLWHWKNDLRRATRWASLAGSTFGFVLMMAGILHVITGDFMVGVWWFVMGIFLRNAAETSYYQVIARTMLGGEPIRRFMTPNPTTVSSDLSLDDVVEEHFYRSLHDMYPVVENSRLIGCISSRQIAGIPREEWKRLTVRDVAVPCSKDNTVGIDTGALTALSIMNRTGNSRLLVMDGDRLVGIVTLKDLMKLLALKLDLERVQ
ncbi:MAG: site-2 protease family protein [Nitrospira sp.]|nr:site-2 protease family protein [Nitrospira sp.]